MAWERREVLKKLTCQAANIALRRNRLERLEDLDAPQFMIDAQKKLLAESEGRFKELLDNLPAGLSREEIAEMTAKMGERHFFTHRNV